MILLAAPVFLLWWVNKTSTAFFLHCKIEIAVDDAMDCLSASMGQPLFSCIARFKSQLMMPWVA